ncbi:MAG: NUDIX domain-containing protein [Bacillota bacterium]|nr:NUDIX domain-containing protein [Bacillota bacterium]
MNRNSLVEMTNLCVIHKENKFLVQKRKEGIFFPGGHIEQNESITASVIREILEETGLSIENPILCGIKDWINEDGSRYIVFLYKTDKFTGNLRSSKEGEVFWVTKEEFETLPVIWEMREVLQICESKNLSELFYDEEDRIRLL